MYITSSTSYQEGMCLSCPALNSFSLPAGADALDRIFRLQFIVIARSDSTSILSENQANAC